MTRVRKRSLPGNINLGKGALTVYTVRNSDGFVANKDTRSVEVHPTPPGFSYIGSEVTQDETHSDWEPSRVKGKFSYDLGGAFESTKMTANWENPGYQQIHGVGIPGAGATWHADYRGPIACTVIGGNNWPGWPSVAQSDLNALGATAIARCSPTNQLVSAANFLAELRSEGLPKLFGATLLKSKSSLFRSLGEEYLNKEFGWDPFVGDLKKLFHQITHADTVLSQYERDSGQMVRRRYEFPEVRTQSGPTFIRNQNALVGEYLQSLFPNVTDPTPPYEILFNGGSTGSIYMTTTTWKKAWFSGAFTYHLPSGYNSRIGMVESARHAQTLLGLDITPEVLWNATPWTWAIDWFSNAGDVVANLSDWATDGLVLKYGYMMEHSICERRIFDDNRGRLKDAKARPSALILRVETKRRVKANPFGFGLTWSGLSPRQIAIAVALGLSKGHWH